MNTEQEANLRRDIDKGQKAEHVLEMYLDGFLTQLEQELYQGFCQSQPDPDQLMDIKRLSMAVAALRNRVLADIDSGKAALKQLSDQQKH